VTATRAEFVETWPPMSDEKLSLMQSPLIAKVRGNALALGSVTLAGGRGGALAALQARLEAAFEFPDISAETRRNVARALYELTGDLVWVTPGR